MAVTNGQVAVDTTAGGTVIVPAANANQSQALGGGNILTRDIFLSNGSGAQVFLGKQGVTTSTGCPLAASTTLRLTIHIDEEIRGIVASTGTTVSYLASGS